MICSFFTPSTEAVLFYHSEKPSSTVPQQSLPVRQSVLLPNAFRNNSPAAADSGITHALHSPRPCLSDKLNPRPSDRRSLNSRLQFPLGSVFS